MVYVKDCWAFVAYVAFLFVCLIFWAMMLRDWGRVHPEARFVLPLFEVAFVQKEKLSLKKNKDVAEKYSIYVIDSFFHFLCASVYFSNDDSYSLFRIWKNSVSRIIFRTN